MADRKAYIQTFLPIRLADVQAKYPGKDANLLRDMALCWAELDASQAMSEQRSIVGMI